MKSLTGCVLARRSKAIGSPLWRKPQVIPASDSFQFSDLYAKITWETRHQGKKPAEKIDLESIGNVGWGVTPSDMVYCSARHPMLPASEEQEPVLFNFIHIQILSPCWVPRRL